MRFFCALRVAVLGCILALAGCGGSGSPSSSSSIPATAGAAKVRFVDGAPFLETIINGEPGDIGTAYLQVDGQTVTSSFAYGSMTSFMSIAAGAHSLRALDTLGYSVGPLKTATLMGGNRYTLIVVGTYPSYQVLAFEEPKNGAGAQMSLYEASPAQPAIDFGTFSASSASNFVKRGSARFGNVATVSLAKSLSNVGAYAGVGTQAIPHGALTLAQINGFDTRNALPFQNASRVSLFLFDAKSSSAGPVFGSLDQ
ncbi:MAG: DUF4397 domain-containing protein [Candidatus Baltobacteraceae bacterium]